MGALIGCCIFGFFLILLGIFFLKLQKKGLAIFELIAGGLFFVAGIFAIALSARQPKSEEYTFSKFKSDYKKAAKICGVPYTLETDVRKGDASTVVFLTDTTTLYITENKYKKIDGFNVSVSGSKTGGFLDDGNYALAVVCAVEGFGSPDEAAQFINSVLDLPADTYMTGKSKYKYSHGIQDSNGIEFNISKTFMTWEEAVKKANQ